MASNTEILIKRSLANTSPASLNQGELAFSYVSNTLFIGSTDGAGAFPIAAYNDFSANYLNGANTYGDQTHIPVITVSANGLITNVTTSQISTTLNFSDGSNTDTLSLINGTLTFTGSTGITTNVTNDQVTFGTDNTVVRSNTETVGPQHISTDVSISGNLTVQGTTTYVQSQVNQTNDSMIELAANNTVGDVVDIGFYGKHEGVGGTVVTGLVRNAGTSDFYLFDNIALGDQANLTSNLITQGALSGNGASLYAHQFLASEGVGSTGGFSFNNDGGLDTGMFSPADGQIDFYSNAVKVFSSNTSVFNVLTVTEFNDIVQIDGGHGLSLKNSDNTDNIYISNQGGTNQSRLVIGDGHLQQNILAVDTYTSNNATQVTLLNSTDIRDGVTGESLLVKGEQKYGVVTQFLVNGADPVTQKEIIDPLVPPAVSNMTPVDLGSDYDDTFVAVTTPFDINFNGTTYTAGSGALFVGSNGYLTFGSGSNNNSHHFPPVATNPGYPAIVVALGDISYQRVYTHDDGNGHFRVRYEGNNIYGGQRIGGSSSIIWEVVFYRDVPGKFDVRIVRLNGTANDGTDGRWNTYLTDGSNFLDTRADRTIPWTTYTQFAKQLTNGSNSLQLLDDGTVKMPNGTVLSDADSGLFVDSLREDATSPDIVYYNATTKELTYGTIADIRADVLSNGVYSWTISGDNGSLTSNVGTQIAASAESIVLGPVGTVDVTNTNSGRVAIGKYAGTLSQGAESVAIGDSAGYNTQGTYAVAIGQGAGNITQSNYAVAIGNNAGSDSQGGEAVAIGANSGVSHQGQYAIAVGSNSGNYTGTGAIGIGYNAGANASDYSVALGFQAGNNFDTALGHYAIAIGYRASYDHGVDNSIVLNASGNQLNASGAGLYINPVRYVVTQDATDDGLVFYNQTTKEVTYSYALDGGSF